MIALSTRDDIIIIELDGIEQDKIYDWVYSGPSPVDLEGWKAIDSLFYRNRLLTEAAFTTCLHSRPPMDWPINRLQLYTSTVHAKRVSVELERETERQRKRDIQTER